MTTNQTIDGVPRELLTQWLAMFEGGIASSPLSALRELTRKALLDAPQVLVVPLTGPKEWLDSLKPAAQPQGEPVAWMNVSTGQFTTSSVVVMDWDDEKEQVQSLYAEQPAPVAVPERLAEVTEYYSGPVLENEGQCAYAEGWNACLDEVARLTATVRIPERLNHADGLHTYEYVTGHNAAIDKMLGVKS